MAETLVQTMIGYYRDRAPIYDQSMGYDLQEIAAAHGPIADFIVEELRGRDLLEVAAGPGFWTSLMSPHCRSLLATDVNQATQDEARKKQLANVRFELADAYDMSNLPSGFSGAFAVDWWSHMPLSKIADFLRALHGRLAPGARVVFVDQLATPDHPDRSLRLDEEGNKIEVRELPGGRSYEIIKNYPTEADLRERSGGSDARYLRDEAVSRWAFAYTIS